MPAIWKTANICPVFKKHLKPSTTDQSRSHVFHASWWNTSLPSI